MLPISIEQLGRRYQMGESYVDALRDVTLEIAPGEFVALLGSSGSGKSTLLNLVGGLDRPTSGRIRVGQIDLGRSSERMLTEHRRNTVGFIFQGFNLLSRQTAFQNVELPLILSRVSRSVRRQRAIAVLEQLGMGERLSHRPTELSGGEQQRVAIARALVTGPAILLADEPTGNLDSARGLEIIELLQHLNRERGLTLLLVTHDQELAGHAQRIVRMRDGQVVEDSLTLPGH